MKIVLSPSLNPYFNLALEEILFNKMDEDYILLWRGRKSVVIGKNQNPFEETNLDYLEEEDIKLARRISGGGTVFHDEGNVNYTMIFNKSKGKFTEFSELMEPIVKFLKEKGLDTYISERNDMRYKEMKISGTAQYTKKNRILHHGTLLFDANESLLSQSLKPKKISYQSNCVKSVRSKIINLKKVLPEEISVETFILHLKDYFIHYFNGENYELDGETIELTKKLVNDKYNTWEWIIGYTPNFKIKDALFHGDQLYEFDLSINKGRIKDVMITLDQEVLKTDHLIDKKYSKALISDESPEALNEIMKKLV